MENQNIITEHYTLNITNGCNLACKYCYVDQTGFGTMSDEVIDQLYKFFEERMQHCDLLKVDIFGGEPLAVWSQTEKLVRKLFKLGCMHGHGRINYIIFTNATLLTEEKALFLKNMKASFNFSLDGGRECHNSQRIYHNGKGSFDDALQGLKNYAKVNNFTLDDVGVLFVLSPQNIRLAYENYQEIRELGIERINTAFVRDDSWSDEDIEACDEFFKKVSDFYIDNIEKYIDEPDKINKHLATYRGCGYFCGICKDKFGIDIKGRLFPCQRYFPYEEMVIGDIWNGVDKDKIIFRAFNNANVYSLTSCNNCKYDLQGKCMGQCYAAIYEKNGRQGMFDCIDCVCKLSKMIKERTEYFESRLKQEKGITLTGELFADLRARR